jgi:hypothetical protein
LIANLQKNERLQGLTLALCGPALRAMKVSRSQVNLSDAPIFEILLFCDFDFKFLGVLERSLYHPVSLIEEIECHRVAVIFPVVLDCISTSIPEVAPLV